MTTTIAPLTEADVQKLVEFHRETVRLLSAVDAVLDDLHLGYNSSVPTDAELAVGPIGRVKVADLRRLQRKARDVRKQIGQRRAITGVKIVTLAYEEAAHA